MGSCNAHHLPGASPDFETHYYDDGPGYGYGDDAADLDFGSDYFSVYADPGLDYDYRWKELFTLVKNQPISSSRQCIAFPGIFPFIVILKTQQSPKRLTCAFYPCFYYGSDSSSSCERYVNSYYHEGFIICPK